MSFTTSRRLFAVASVLATVAALVASPAAASATPAHSSRLSFTIRGGIAPSARIRVHGVANGRGTDWVGSDTAVVVLRRGVFTISHPSVTAHFTGFDPTTCSASFVESGPYTLERGYGAYDGIRGHGTLRGTGTVRAAIEADGLCNTNDLVGGSYTVTGSGPASD